MTDFITVSAGGPPPDEDIPDGAYVFILSALSDPKSVTVRRGPKAGQDIDLIDWDFAVNQPGTPFDGRVLTESTSTASGPRSKMNAWLTALFGGVTPPPGTKLKKEDIVGRQAVGTVTHDDGGWPRLSNLGAMLTTAPTVQSAAVPAVVAAPAAPTQPATDNLPF